MLIHNVCIMITVDIQCIMMCHVYVTEIFGTCGKEDQRGPPTSAVHSKKDAAGADLLTRSPEQNLLTAKYYSQFS